MSDNDLLKITETVTEARKISDSAFAKKLGCNEATISRWRSRGIPHFPRIVLEAIKEKKITWGDITRWTNQQHKSTTPDKSSDYFEMLQAEKRRFEQYNNKK